ncbi:undecaprenyldiphospho-muramoylpentapeptide beta-N-acetylglucosaminyltransferase, partial [Alloacidobacterium sp.]|uniref:undecaprenyldiphospho-muramoylpentapeptide beta-N-acetylglucosaminyltransferase n=1 Tax=Alloacidobacterium sp. TaxID=2951999 RepID=UPI002D455869
RNIALHHAGADGRTAKYHAGDRVAAVRVLIAGGGTGGHIMPALAIADALQKQYQSELLFVGTPRGLESRLVPQAGHRLELIQVGQLKNVSLATRVRTMLDLPMSVLHCRKLLKQFHPNVVVGVGGYASGPAMVAAIIAHIPTLAVEPNAFPGLANRLVGKHISAAAVNFEPALRFFRNAQVTGIPVRTEFFNLKPRPEDAPPHLLIFGGSQGARVLNRTMPQIVARLLDAIPGLTILHQAGSRHAEETQAAYTASGTDPTRWQVHAFLDDMAKRFEAADLVLSRSGASTVAEEMAAGKPALLVPFPGAADDHQRKNAEVMAGAGAARMLIESEMTPERLLESLTGMLKDRAELRSMGDRVRILAHPDAAAQIAKMTAGLAK